MTPEVIFRLNKEKDLRNIWETCNSKTSYGYDFKNNLSKETLKACSGKSFENCKNYLEKKRAYIYSRESTKIAIRATEESWKGIEKKYFKKLEKITNEKMRFKEVQAFPTTISRCPYNPNKDNLYYFFNLFKGIEQQLITSAHELMHIHLHNTPWWKEVEGQLGNNKTHDLKEALTELLNIEFKELFIFSDNSYPNHQKLRKYINKKWKEKKDFTILTNSCIKWIKRNGIK